MNINGTSPRRILGSARTKFWSAMQATTRTLVSQNLFSKTFGDISALRTCFPMIIVEIKVKFNLSKKVKLMWGHLGYFRSLLSTVFKSYLTLFSQTSTMIQAGSLEPQKAYQ